MSLNHSIIRSFNHSIIRGTRQGSALLIVLGMVSFMVISAVAFSAYMRYSRLPSSYLRRTSSSRHLVKAALAEAIDQIDVAIGDNPHPGFGTRSSTYPRDGGWTAQRNYWRDRCFIGTNQLLEASETVSVLNLEALAHLPPSLVNEARYYSRHSATATWQDLGYDSGRFAFFAVDVSDCFDVNRVPANWARNSSDLGKVSFAYAFENANHTSYTVSPSAWDGFMDNYVDFEDQMDGTKGANSGASKMPLVSLADLNLAAYSKAGSLAQYVSPFCSYLMNGAEFVADETGPVAETMRALNVITDALYPPMAVGAGDADIMNPGHQPFTRIDAGETQPNNRTVLQRIRTTGIGKILSNELPPLDLINLYDYLDENDVPTSLALPTTERVPMVCGLQAALKLHVEPKSETTFNPANCDPAQNNTELAENSDYTETMTCRLKVQGTGAVTPMWMFPFQRDDGVPTSGYTAETALRIAFLTDAPGLRTKSASALVVQDEAGFTAGGVVNGAICPKLTTASPSFSNVTTENDAFRKQNLTANLNEAATWFEGHPIVTVTKHWKVHYNVNQATGEKTRADTEDTAAREVVVNQDFKPLAADGVTDGGLSKDTFFGAGVKIRPYLTIASRVTKNSKTVDLVPASGLDDNKYNGISSDTVLCNLGGGASSQPILSFAGDKEITFSEAAFKSPQAQDIVLQTGDSGGYITCPDPRWNFAPENFLLTASGTLNENQYLSDLRNDFLDKDGRDCDIFMAVSNQGYLQSISELAMLPRTGVDFGGGNAQTGDAGFSFDKAGFETDRTKLANYNLMWRTYRLWGKGNYARDPIYELGVMDGGRGTRVNPYTASTYATLAALANTPYSWWAASTNYNATGKGAVPDDNAEQFNRKYAFSAMNNNAKFAWEDLKKIAEKLSAAMRANDNGDWVEGWENLDWGCVSKTGEDRCDYFFSDYQFQGDTDGIYDVDRKFLYGYWRDCFAAKQQLFLVFVRAEPMMMGGGQIGQTPPQLGARAVALVWRNPAAGSSTSFVGGGLDLVKDFLPPGANKPSGSSDPKIPHRTRVLFYRQFD